MTTLLVSLVLLPGMLFGYAYVLYPGILWLLARRRMSPLAQTDPAMWPSLTISLPVYNESRQVESLLESLLALDYPRDRLQILVVSDCSSDGTDDLALAFADRGVEVLRVPERKGKTAAEQFAHAYIRGELVLNTDASIRIHRNAVKALVRQFQDPGVGVATGRDVSVGDLKTEGNQGESGYVGYEMAVRALETRLGGIVGASGSLYVIRSDLHRTQLPEELSRDFASALIAREHGFRAVSVDEALCVVPRTTSLSREYHRKVRTMARGLNTLFYKRHLMNPFSQGAFAVKLISHKLARWLVYLSIPVAAVALLLLSPTNEIAEALSGVAALLAAVGAVGMLWPADRKVPAVFAIPGFALAAIVAGLLAWQKVFMGDKNPTWEPTRRPT